MYRYWTKQKCLEEVLKYKTVTEFKKNSRGAHGAAIRNGWLDELCKHMPINKIVRKPYTKVECNIEAKKYKTRSEWEKNNRGTYRAAHRKGWLDECCKHMIYLRKPN